MKQRNKFNQKIQKRICEIYSQELKTTREIACQFKCSKGYIVNILRKNNTEIRGPLNSRIRNRFNRNFFKKIDSEEKAYFLGFLYADGCNFKEGVSISLQEEDSYILEKFKQIINHSYPLYKTIPKNKKWKTQIKLQITSKEFSNDLSALGCIPKKSLILKFPTSDQVPPDLIHHFIRGYFDGDGCISWGFHNRKGHKNKRICGQFSITSSKPFSEDLMIKLKTLGEIKTIITKRFDNCEAYTIRSNGGKQIKLLYKFLYKDSTIFLNRKKNKMEEFINLIRD